ncbi:MFS transporter [Polaromonas sp.]|jgi:MFS family permease|uniref:MFS transporter n=1 Tax=Polaromonas sp. TaxID=1869339 RepID=UPI002C374D62|nr:MFS transporter [Polaromonas sp.]HQS32416.1 MFS transporter [Polaromonas sp.]HQS90995.1 MFS transporter [Polaromonas sp.]
MSSSSTLDGSAAGVVSLRHDAGVMGLVGTAHLISHFSQLLLAPLFPWLKEEFAVSYTELGLLMTIFFVVSSAVQALSGFAVDRLGPRPVLFVGLGLIGVAAFGYSVSTSYWMLAGWAVVAGTGNGVFHPVNYTLLNHKVSAPRLGHAYSVHGITGSLGWALAPAMLVPIALAFSWRAAMASAGVLVFVVLAVLLLKRETLKLPPVTPARAHDLAAAGGSFAFLRIPSVWMCFAFFFFYAIALGAVQAFAPEAARQLHGMPLRLLATSVSVYMVCSAVGMVLGGFLAADPARCERVVGVGFGFAASMALALGLLDVPGTLVPALFGLMGFATGAGAPSRDLIVKRATPPHATGRVYGVVYSGLDIGQALSPLIFGSLMDHRQFQGVFLGLALVQGVLIVSAFNVKRARRTSLMPA